MSDVPERLTAALAGRYTLEREVGAGGMATVYLATDLKHQRQVAIKVLKPELAAVLGAERFLAEIRTTANLQHPHILPLFDSGEADGFLFYVMPYIEGETLRGLLDRERQLGVDQAVEITRAVASALDYAHRNDVVHRDIKPENILMHDGNPVVADFGIALAVSAAGGGRMTETGLSLGTPHYMSPEQASADGDATGRSDVYALGCVLYEMLAGAPPHTGPSAQAVLVRILTEIPALLTTVRHSVPRHVEAATAKALEKLPADRFATAEAFRSALADESFTHTAPQQAAPAVTRSSFIGPGPHTRGRPILPWTIAVAAVAVAVAGWLGRGTDTASPPAAGPSIQTELWRTAPASLARLQISETGSVLTAGFDGRLVERGPDGEFVTTEGSSVREAAEFDYAPDGSSIGFVTEAGVYVVPAGGGDAYRVAEVEDARRGLTWAAPDLMYVSASVGLDTEEVTSHLLAVSPATGAVDTVTSFPGLWAEVGESASEEVLFLSVGDLVTGERTVVALDVRSGDTVTVARDAESPAWVSTGHLVYLQLETESLFAVPFEPATLEVTGDPRRVLAAAAQRVTRFDVTPDGTLVYAALASDEVGAEEMIWLGGNGTSESLPLPPVSHADPSLSPDGRRMAYVRDDEIMVFDLDLGTNRPIVDGGIQLHNPVWSPAGDRIAVRGTFGDRESGVWVIDVEGDEAPRMIFRRDVGAPLSPVGWYEDGTILVTSRELPDRDIFALDDDPDTPIRDVLVADWIEYNPAISPDLRWIAYTTDEDGVPRIVVRSWPDLLNPVVVSEGDDPIFIRTEGGGLTVWADDSSTLYYQQQDRVVAARVDGSGDEIRVEGHTTLPVPLSERDGIWDLHPDGERFLAVRISSEGMPIHLVTNFQRRIADAFGAN
jgi:serine/threonine-protein kinase